MPWSPESWVNTGAIRSGQLYDLNESRLQTEDLNRVIAKENLAMAQAEAQRKADMLKMRQQQAAAMQQALLGGGASQEPVDPARLAEQIAAEQAQAGGTAGPVMDEMSSPANSGGTMGLPTPTGGPQMAPAGPGAPGAPGAPPGMPPAGFMPGEQGGIPSQAMAPMQEWAQANPLAAMGMIQARAEGDGEGYRKYLTQYQDWAKRDVFSDPYSIPGEKGLFKRNLRTNEVEKIGGGDTNIDVSTKGATKYAEEEGKGASARRQEYLTQGAAAKGQLAGYHRFYQNVMTADKTGAFGDARVGLARLGQFLDMPPEWIKTVSGLTPDQTGLYETMQSQAMDAMFKRIEATKGAISNREMELFKNASPGISKTRKGNILLLETMMEVEARKVQYEQYIRERTRGAADSQALEDAEYDWNQKYNERPQLFNDAWLERRDQIMATPDRAITRLMQNRGNPKDRQMFKQAFGWLPRGM